MSFDFEVGVEFDDGGKITIVGQGMDARAIDAVFNALRPLAPWLPTAEVVAEASERFVGDE